jgi:hypothetical protein
VSTSSLITGPKDPGPVGRCDCCGQEIYPDDLVHVIDGFTVCPECFFDFAFDYFSRDLVPGSALKEENHGDTDTTGG